MIHILGRGVVGQRIASSLADLEVSVHSGHHVDVGDRGDVAILAHGGAHADQVLNLLLRGMDVVSIGDEAEDVGRLIDLSDDLPADRCLIVGAATAPGLSGLLAREGARRFASIDEIHVAVHGTAGPVCARAYHDSLSGWSDRWHDGDLVRELAGSGRQLCWFPEPIGGKDCYLARSPEAMLLHRAFPQVARITHRRAARRRDRLTARLPMLSPPPAEGAIGGLWVELRGVDHNGGRLTLVSGVAELIATATASVAAAFAREIASGALDPGCYTPGEAGLPTRQLLRDVVASGVRLQRFTGVPTNP